MKLLPAPKKDGILQSSSLTQLAALMQRAGWEIDNLDVNMQGPSFSMQIHSHDGLLVYARTDSLGRSNYETFSRSTSLMKPGKGRVPLVRMPTDTFLGRHRFDNHALMIESLGQYICDNGSNSAISMTVREALTSVLVASKDTANRDLPEGAPA